MKVFNALKYYTVTIIISLSLCGIVFIVVLLGSDTGGTVCKTKPTVAKFTLIKLDNSIQEFILDLNQYPVKLSDLYNDTGQNMWLGPYIKEKELKDPWGTPYYYQYFPDRNGYQLYTLGADHKVGGSDQTIDQISAASLKFIEFPKQYFKKIP